MHIHFSRFATYFIAGFETEISKPQTDSKSGITFSSRTEQAELEGW
jgi:hypothetical protein